MTTLLKFETAVSAQANTHYIAGIDEAGRGSLAGPVVAAAAILPLTDPLALAKLSQVNDSKLLTARRREVLFEVIRETAVAFGVGIVPASTIDAIGIMAATRQAMVTAVRQITPAPDFLLIDGRIRLPALPIGQQSIIRGDSQSLSIAAASILAKVTRDRLMVDFEPHYPLYGFAQHKGYGTERHRAAIAQYGPCPIHRHTFAPIRPELI